MITENLRYQSILTRYLRFQYRVVDSDIVAPGFRYQQRYRNGSDIVVQRSDIGHCISESLRYRSLHRIQYMDSRYRGQLSTHFRYRM